jgi:hypothetical protein
MMAQGTANLRAIPYVLAEALQATLALNPSHEGQKAAQRDIATALETALDARRHRILISESQVNLLKWACLFIQAVCALVPYIIFVDPLSSSSCRLSGCVAPLSWRCWRTSCASRSSLRGT